MNSRFRALLGVVLSLVFPLPSFGGNLPEVFKVKTVDGKEYIPLKNIAEFYNFTETVRHEDRIVMEKRGTVAKFEIGSTGVDMNGQPFHLARPLRVVEEEPCLSRIDLEKLIHPVLMPKDIPSLKPLATLILDFDPADPAVDDPKRRYPLPPYAQALRDSVESALKVERGKTHDIRLVTTFEGEKEISLRERLAVINHTTQPAAVFSFRMMKSGEEEGALASYVLSPAGVAHMGRHARPSDLQPLPANAADGASMVMAGRVQHRIARDLTSDHLQNGGVRWGRDPILMGSSHPTILIEYDCGQAEDEADLFGDQKVLDSISKALAEGLRGKNWVVR